MLALALITLELETCCPDWLALTIDLLRKAQVPADSLSLLVATCGQSEALRRISADHVTKADKQKC